MPFPLQPREAKQSRDRLACSNPPRLMHFRTIRFYRNEDKNPLASPQGATIISSVNKPVLLAQVRAGSKKNTSLYLRILAWKSSLPSIYARTQVFKILYVPQAVNASSILGSCQIEGVSSSDLICTSGCLAGCVLYSYVIQLMMRIVEKE